MFKQVTFALYNLKQHIESIPDPAVRDVLLQECEQMHQHMMSVCMIKNESKNFMLKSPFSMVQRGERYETTNHGRANSRLTAA